MSNIQDERERRIIPGALLIKCEHGSLLVSVLDFLTESRWFEPCCLKSFCFLRQETVLQTVFYHLGIQMGI